MAFIHIEKAAGTTILDILKRSFGMQHWDTKTIRRKHYLDFFSVADYHRYRIIYPRVISIAGHDIKPYSDLEKQFINLHYYTFLRDPVKRCASYYQYLYRIGKMRAKSFEEWIAKDEFRNFQTKKLVGQNDVGKAIRMIQKKKIFVGIVENFDESLFMLRRFFAPSLDLDIRYRKKNVAPDNLIKDRLLNNRDTMQMLIEANQLDQHLYNFVKKELFPQQQREYGVISREDIEALRVAQNKPLGKNLAVYGYLLKRTLIYKPIRFYFRHLASKSKSTAPPDSEGQTV